MKPEANHIREQVLKTLDIFGESAKSFEGKKPGFSMLTIGGTHANEILGILVLEKLFENLTKKNIKLTAGVLSLMLGNTEAIKLNKRSVPGRPDLNRVFTPAVLSGADDLGWEGKRARDIVQVMKQHKATLDEHSTQLPSDPFVFARIDKDAEAIYKWLPSTATVEDPLRLMSGGSGTVDEAAQDLKTIGICHESGIATDTTNVKPVYQAILNIMKEKGMIEGNLPAAPELKPAYTLVATVPYDHALGGICVFGSGKQKSFAPIAKGEIIGVQNGKPIYSEVDGVILFPKTPELQTQSGVVCYLAEPKTT